MYVPAIYRQSEAVKTGGRTDAVRVYKSNTSPKKLKVRNCYKRDTHTGKYLTFIEVKSLNSMKVTCKDNINTFCQDFNTFLDALE